MYHSILIFAANAVVMINDRLCGFKGSLNLSFWSWRYPVNTRIKGKKQVGKA